MERESLYIKMVTFTKDFLLMTKCMELVNSYSTLDQSTKDNSLKTNKLVQENINSIQMVKLE
jgi:hypothetical protein